MKSTKPQLTEEERKLKAETAKKNLELAKSNEKKNETKMNMQTKDNTQTVQFRKLDLALIKLSDKCDPGQGGFSTDRLFASYTYPDKSGTDLNGVKMQLRLILEGNPFKTKFGWGLSTRLFYPTEDEKLRKLRELMTTKLPGEKFNALKKEAKRRIKNKETIVREKDDFPWGSIIHCANDQWKQEKCQIELQRPSNLEERKKYEMYPADSSFIPDEVKRFPTQLKVYPEMHLDNPDDKESFVFGKNVYKSTLYVCCPEINAYAFFMKILCLNR